MRLRVTCGTCGAQFEADSVSTQAVAQAYEAWVAAHGCANPKEEKEGAP